MSRQDIKKRVADILQSEGSDRVVDKQLVNEMQGSFLEYSMSVIKSRALPDYRDGLKPVHRRIIFAASQEGLTHDKKYKKSAAIVGSVMGSYHPHGDMAIYDALVRMAQSFSLRYPLIQGQGNFGSIDGDSPAAMRYTEARLSELSGNFTDGLGEDWVDMVDNYDQSKKEPVVLPTIIPNLLVNGSEGIAVGLATKIPPHNLSEVIDASIALIKDPNITTEQLQDYIQGPDFPTGGEVLDYYGVQDYLGIDSGKTDKNGRLRIRSFRIRGKARVEQGDNKGRERIIIEEIPYGVKKTSIIKQIVDGMDQENKRGRYVPAFDQYIRDIRDESSRDEIRIVIEFQGCSADVILNNLYKYTNLQISYCTGLVVLINNEPKKLNVLEVLHLYISHQLDMMRKRAAYRIGVLNKRIHILEGRLIIVDDILEAVKIITTSDDPDKELQTKYSLSDEQLKDIMSLQVGRLKKMSVSKMHDEKKEKIEERTWNEELLASEEKQKEELIKKLSAVKEKYGDARRTKINKSEKGFVPIEDTRHYENMVFSLSKKSYLSQVPLKDLKLTRRRNKTGSELKMAKSDLTRFLLPCHGRDDLLFFTDLGRVYKKKAYEFNLKSGLESEGRMIRNLIPGIQKNENVVSMIRIEKADYSNGELFLVFVTKYGQVKKTEMKEFKTVFSAGKVAMRLLPKSEFEDKLAFVLKADFSKGNKPDLCLVSSGAKDSSGRVVNNILRCSLEDEFKVRKKGAGGVHGMRLPGGQHIICAASTQEGKSLVIVDDHGYAKTVDISKISPTHRYRSGWMLFKQAKKDAADASKKLLACVLAKPEDEVLFIASVGKEDSVRRMRVSDIGKKQSKMVRGNQLLNADDVKQNARISYFTKLSYNQELDVEDEDITDEEGAEE